MIKNLQIDMNLQKHKASEKNVGISELLDQMFFWLFKSYPLCCWDVKLHIMTIVIINSNFMTVYRWTSQIWNKSRYSL